MVSRESMKFDVVIVGAGPAGLSAACRLMLQARAEQQEISVCVVEKGVEVGAHILSGALFDTRALDELFPDWQEREAPLQTRVSDDRVFMLTGERSALQLPPAMVPSTLHNRGNYIISLGSLCRWLAAQAEQLGVDIFPGFAAADILYHPDGSVKGIVTGDMGIAADGRHKDSYIPGIELHAGQTLFTEGSRGHLGKQLIARYRLDKGRDPQHYGIGLKELWEIDPARHHPGLVIHGTGWPLGRGSSGGFFLYHAADCQVAVGLIVDLNYRNPWLSPFDEFQRLKHHPLLARYLRGGERIAYGARSITKGGFNSLPRMTMPGALLLGCDAGTLDMARIKGIHTAMKSGMLAADTLLQARSQGELEGRELTGFAQAFKGSWLHEELYRGRNFGPALHRLGPWLGGAFNSLEQSWLGSKLSLTLHDRAQDHLCLTPAADCSPIPYPRPDGILSFDKLSSVYLSNTQHEEDQPCHLKLADPAIPINQNLPRYAEPAQRYCPAGVYEVIEDERGLHFQINAANCVHCKTCDIKDPAQNITWVTPEGGSGPTYPNM